MANRQSSGPFLKIGGVQKFTNCKSCGKRIRIKNFNQRLCKECGYRENRHKDEGTEDEELW
jgi:predicted RNA-binding Zn-ribbon protein involved in translation (DUF1610 family)